ncbi:MAG: glycoside hydrolase family 9 protein [Cytophagaceae bacterium]|nr:glycoside hydrolase family 9 protein [Cytophagaceae bacterium]
MKLKLKSLIITYLVSISYLLAGPGVTDNHIKVDQFGYRCTAQKIAVISNPVTGYNNGSTFSPGTGANQYQVRRWSDDVAVFTGTLTAWSGGATHGQSGDQIWWFDFSAYTTSGSYYIYDLTRNVGSYRFDIRDDVYLDPLKASVRSFYYQRCGVAKTAANAGTGWADPACHTGTQQDTDCRLYSNAVIGTSKNLSGGWHDAGDYNKYVNFTWGTLIDLLLAYEESPTVWADNYNIPESGNGIPDLLDEVKYELDWLLKMQQPDGSVLSIVGGGAGSPPSASTAFRRYGPANTSSALTCAGVFALAAIQYKSLGIPAMTTYGNTLQTASINAYNWAVANPGVTFYNSGVIGAGEQEVNNYGRLVRQIAAAGFLYALTGTTAYRTYFDANYNQVNMVQWPFAYAFESYEQDMLLYYSKTAGATAAVATNIRNIYSSQISTNNADFLPAYNSNTDAYRAYMASGNYTWGSNSTKSKSGSMFMNMIVHNLDAGNATNYRNAASGYIHYIHGVNPTAFCFLSNMSSMGSENSINEFYHSWFYDGSALWDRVGTSTYGPAPGFLSGGPNPSYNVDACCGSSTCGALNARCAAGLVTPPLGQPTQKSYKDWNENWPQNSWSVTENGIYYQAAYTRLLSKFCTGSCGVLPVQLSKFTAYPTTDKKVELLWETSSEKNNDYFTIERSQNGIDFTAIGTVYGAGNSSQTLQYSYIDAAPLSGYSYYRLKQTDIDGTSHYSEIKQIQTGISSVWNISPVPAQNEIRLTYLPGTGIDTDIKMTDALGKIILSAKEFTANTIHINISNLNPGVYFLYLRNEDQTFTEKIIKE